MIDDPWRPEGIYACNGCVRTYPEYINGCLNDHPAPRSVRLVVPDADTPAPSEDNDAPMGFDELVELAAAKGINLVDSDADTPKEKP